MLLRETSITAHDYLANSMVMSGDGRLIAFVGTEAGMPGSLRGVLVHDASAGFTRAIAALNPALSNLETIEPALSADGSKIAFVIKSTGQVAVLTLADGTLTFATGAGVGEANGSSAAPGLSADGRYVVFESAASNLVAGDLNGLPDIFVRDLQGGSMTRIEASDAELSRPQISGDGQSVLFLDSGSLYLQKTGAVKQLVSSGITSGQDGNGYVLAPYELSADGKYAVFAEHIASIAHFDSRHGADVYRKDVTGAELKQIYVPSQFEFGEILPTHTVNIEPEVSSDASLVTYVRSSTFAPATVSLFIHDLLNGDVSQFAPEVTEPWPGYCLPESSLSSDGTHFGYVFKPLGTVAMPELLRVSTVLRGANAPGAGDQTIEGGIGIDTLTYQGNRSEYLIVGQSISDSQAGRHGKDTLIGIERLHFNDGNIALDTAGVAGQVFRLYQAAFMRAPDQAGAGFWIHALDQGHSLLSVAESFATSSEFQVAFGALSSNTQIVDHLYQNILHRAGDSAGIAYWTKVLDEGRASVPELLIAFSESGENVVALAGPLQGGVPYLPFS